MHFLPSIPVVRDVPTSAAGIVFQEKIIGTQVMFGLDERGKLYCRTKQGDVSSLADEPLSRLMDHLKSKDRAIHQFMAPGDCVFAMHLSTPRQKGITYGRIPNNGCVVFGAVKGGIYHYKYPFSNIFEFEVIRTHVPVTTDDFTLPKSQLDGDKVAGLIFIGSNTAGVTGIFPVKSQLILLKASSGQASKIGVELESIFQEVFAEAKLRNQIHNTIDDVPKLCEAVLDRLFTADNKAKLREQLLAKYTEEKKKDLFKRLGNWYNQILLHRK